MTAPIEMKAHEVIALRANDIYQRMAGVVLPLGDELDAMSLLCGLLLLQEATFQAAEANGMDRELLKRQLREMFPEGPPRTGSPEDPN